MTRLTIRLFGSFQVLLNGEPVRAFESDMARALLAYLAVESGEAHRRGKLAGLFWPESPERRARASLSQALHNLRSLLGDLQAAPAFLEVSRDTIQFNRLSDHWLDVAAFTEHVEESRGHDHPSLEGCEACLERLGQAVSIYRDDFLADLHLWEHQAFQEWSLMTRERLHRQVVEVLSQLAECHERRGEFDLAMQYATRGVELDPLREALQWRLMRLLAGRGQRSEALAQYIHFHRTLSDELGVAPGAQIAGLYEQLRAETVVEQPTGIASHNLPEPLTPFIGRQRELVELQERLLHPHCRLLTVLGPGGSGKTRLALEVARAALPTFDQGVYLVPLSHLASPVSIYPAIAAALGIPLRGNQEPADQIRNYLRNRKLLLVMDSYEHLLEGALVVSELLRAAPGVKVLVTSRARLNLKGELLYPLKGMQYSDQGVVTAGSMQFEAVHLFLSGARRVKPDYQPESADLEYILQVCRQVLGMPLGILLASAWVTTFRPEEIAAEIAKDLDFLSSEWVDMPARQRSLRATYDYTWSLLHLRARAVFQSLSVFRGGFTRSAARAVCGASPHELRALVDRSLLSRTTSMRYEIHELLRQYGAEHLEAAPEAKQRAQDLHSAYYAEILEDWEKELKSPRQEIALHEMDFELENLRAAWNWAADQGLESRIEAMLEGLCRYYDLRSRYQEGQSACRFASERLVQQDVLEDGWRVRIHLHIWESHFNNLLGEYEAALKLIEESQALLEQARLAGPLTHLEGALLDLELGKVYFSRDLELAQEYYLRSLKAFEELNDAWHVMTTQALLGICSTQRGHFDEAQDWCEKSLKLAQSHGDPRNVAATLRRLGLLHLRKGEFELGLQVMEEASRAYQLIGDQAIHAAGLHGLGQAHFWLGRYSESLDLLQSSLKIYEAIGNLYEVAFINALIGGLMIQAGLYREAEHFLETSLSMARENGNRRLNGGSLLLKGWIQMGEMNFERAHEFVQEGITHYRKLKHLDELGWALATLGYTTSQLGNLKRATELLCEALGIGLKTRAYMTVCQTLAPFAVLLGQNGDPARSLELYTVICQNPLVAASKWFEDVYGHQIDGYAESLPAELAESARERGSNRDLWETAAELLEEMECTISH